MTDRFGTETLHTHDITLSSGRLVLRPLREEDWDVLLAWNNDPEILRYVGEDVEGYTLEEVQDLYRAISRSAYCFMIEYDGVRVGECWLQRMNLERIIDQYPGQDVRRIDLMIGDKSQWGQGIGAQTIQLLVDFAFTRQNAEAVFACEVADYNTRSLRAFQKVGFRVCATQPQPPGTAAREKYDLVVRRPAAG